MTEAVRTASAVEPVPRANRPTAIAAKRSTSAEGAGKSAPSGDGDKTAERASVQRPESAKSPAIERSERAGRKAKASDGDGQDVESSDTFATAVDEITRASATTQNAPTADTSSAANAAALVALMAAPGQTPPPTVDVGTAFARHRGGSIALSLAKLNQADAENVELPVAAAEQGAAPDGQVSAKVTVHAQETHWFTGERMAVAAKIDEAAMASVSKAEAASEVVSLAAKPVATKPPADTAVPAAKASASEPNLPAIAIDPTPGHDAPGNDAPGNGGASMRHGEGDAHRAKAGESVAVVAKSAVATSEVGQAPAAATLPAVQQVKQIVLDALAGKETAPPAAPTVPDRPAAPGYVLRSIEVTLAPPDLGAVRLKLSLKDNALAIDAQASKASTAAMLKDDRGVLEQNLREAGYDVAAVRISDVSAGSSAAFTGNSQTGNPPGQGRTGDWQQQLGTQGGGDGQRRGNSGSEQQRQFMRTPEQPLTRVSDRSETKGIYI